MAVHETVVPDCPECGHEMVLLGKTIMNDGKAAFARWYECRLCHVQSPKCTSMKDVLPQALEWCRRYSK